MPQCTTTASEFEIVKGTSLIIMLLRRIESWEIIMDIMGESSKVLYCSPQAT